MARSTTVGTLFVQFKTSMDSWNAELKSMSKETKAFEKVLKPTKDLAKELGTGLVAAGAAITGALTAMVLQAANYGDAIRDASIHTGIATDQLGMLKYTAEQNGLSFEGMQAGLKKFAVAIHEAGTGSKEQQELFKAMGVSVRDAKGQFLPITDVLGKVSDKFNRMPDGVQKTALAVKLFGKGGIEMIEFLSLGSAGMKEFEERAKRLGLAIGPDFADMADASKDALADMKAALTGLSIAVGAALLPTLTRLATTIANTIATVRDFAAEHQFLTKAVAALGTALTGAGGLFLAFAAILSILPSLTAAWTALSVAMTANPVGVMVVGFAALTAAVYVFRNEISGATAKAISIFLDGLRRMAEGASTVAYAIGMDGLSGMLDDAAKALRESSAELSDMSDVLLAGEPTIIKNTAKVDALAKKHGELSEAIDESKKKAKEWKQELPEVLPWFLRANAAEAFSGAGGIGRRSQGQMFESLPMPQPSGAAASADASAAPTNVVFAPNLYFDGVPADTEKFLRTHFEPALQRTYESGSNMKKLSAALRANGIAVQHG